MTDIEKRAHDIAISSVNAKLNFLIEEFRQKQVPISYDYYIMYKNAYDDILTHLKSDYPE